MKHLLNQDIPAFLDGAITAEQRSRVELHCAACAACRAELALQRAIGETVRTGSHVEPSFGFTARVMDGIIPAPSRQRWLVRNVPAWLMAAGIAVMLVVMIASPEAPRYGSAPGYIQHSIELPSAEASQFISEAIGELSAMLLSMFGGAAGLTMVLAVMCAIVVSMSRTARHTIVAGRRSTES